MLVRIAVLASYLLPPLVGFFFLRKAGRTRWGALVGAVQLFAIAIALHLLLFMAAAGVHAPPEIAAYVLPFALAALFAHRLRHPD